MNRRSLLNCFRQLSSQSIVPNVCVVGAGPAGFYTIQQILKTVGDVRIDILEKLPTPFGLVRFGVAPDHPEVKNVINTFNKVAKDKRVQFLGNVEVGKDLTLRELRDHYHAVILTYGAEEDRVLDIPGESLKNVISAKRFVGWYNGVPSDKDLEIDLSGEDAVILGQGNVAIDVARILLSPVDRLKSTDITSHSLARLSESKVRRVWLVGRRGPLQAAFTIAELREMLRLDNCKTYWRAGDFEGVKEALPGLARPKRRIVELMLKSVEESSSSRDEGSSQRTREFRPVFLRGPRQLLGSERVEAVELSVNKLEGGEDVVRQVARPSEASEIIGCGLAFRSIGYRSARIDPDLPFDSRAGKIVNEDGKVQSALYAAGWVATGPLGVILSTMTNSFKVGQLVGKELLRPSLERKDGFAQLKGILERRNVVPISYEGWERIDREECLRGNSLGKPREKILDIAEMLHIATANTHS